MLIQQRYPVIFFYIPWDIQTWYPHWYLFIYPYFNPIVSYLIRVVYLFRYPYLYPSSISLCIRIYPTISDISQKYILYVIPDLIRKYPHRDRDTLPWGLGPGRRRPGQGSGGPAASRWWLAHVCPSQLFYWISSGRHKLSWAGISSLEPDRGEGTWISESCVRFQRPCGIRADTLRQRLSHHAAAAGTHWPWPSESPGPRHGPAARRVIFELARAKARDWREQKL